MDEPHSPLTAHTRILSRELLAGGAEGTYPAAGDWLRFLGNVQSAPAVSMGRVERRHQVVVPNSDDPHVALFNQLVELKVVTARIAMHLESAWRAGLFRQLDELLDAESWDFSDELPSQASFLTFLRLVVLLGKPRRPSLGATGDGNIIAAWTRGRERLTIECQPDDQLRWIVVRYFGDDRESAAGTCKVARLLSRLGPFGPEIWFDADGVRSGRPQSTASRQSETRPEG
jgi:hypothetical protein